MGRGTLIVLGCLALALATYLALGDRSPVAPGSQRLLPGFARAGVTALRVEVRGRSPVVLRRADRRWWLAAPVRGEAEPAMVEGILSAVEFLEPTRRLGPAPSPKRAKRLGLAPPRISLEIHGGRGAGRKTRLLVGAEDPSGRGRYLRLADGEPCVVAGELARLLRVEPAALRRRAMVPLAGSEIDEVKLVRADGVTRLARRDGRWTVTTRDGLSARGHVGRILRLVSALSGLAARGFPRLARPVTGRAGSVTRIVVAGRAGGRRLETTLAIGGVCPGRADRRLVGRREPPKAGAAPAQEQLWACVDGEALAPLEVEAASLRDRRLTAATASGLTSISIARGGRTLRLKRLGGGAWSLGSAEADPAVVASWVEALGVAGELEPARQATLTALEGPGATRVVLVDEQGRSERILIGAGEGRGAARRGDERVVLRVPQAALPPLDADPLHFRSRQVLSLSRFAVAEIRTTRRAADGSVAGRELIARLDGGPFVVREPVSMPVDSEHVQALLDRLSALRATRFVTPVGGRTTPTGIEVDLRIRTRRHLLSQGRTTEAVTHRLVLRGTQDPSTPCVVRLPGTGSPPFELAAADCALLSRWRGTRRPAHGIVPRDLRRIKIDGLGPRPLVLERRELTWYEGQRLADPARVARLVGALVGLQAELIGYGIESRARRKPEVLIALGSKARPDWRGEVLRDLGDQRSLRVRASRDAGMSVSYRLSKGQWRALRDALAGSERGGR